MTTKKADFLKGLTDQELAERVNQEIADLCGAGRMTRAGFPRKRWTMSVPVDFDRDSDVLFAEMLRRYRLLAHLEEEVITDDAMDTGPAGDNLRGE